MAAPLAKPKARTAQRANDSLTLSTGASVSLPRGRWVSVKQVLSKTKTYGDSDKMSAQTMFALLAKQKVSFDLVQFDTSSAFASVYLRPNASFGRYGTINAHGKLSISLKNNADPSRPVPEFRLARGLSSGKNILPLLRRIDVDATVQDESNDPIYSYSDNTFDNDGADTYLRLR